jgi:hypothetical protein
MYLHDKVVNTNRHCLSVNSTIAARVGPLDHHQKYAYKNFSRINNHTTAHCGPGSVIGKATGYGLDGAGIESR